MKKFKSLSSLLLCAVLILTLFAGCNTTKESTGSTETPPASSTSTDDKSSESTSETPAPAAGVVDYSDPSYISAEVIKPRFFFTSEGADGSEIAWQAIKKYTNIEFDLVPIPLASFNDKLATTLASGDLPDVMGLREYKTVEKYGPQGAFMSFEPYIEQGLMPNYISVLDAFPPAMKLSTAPDGMRYSAPRIYEGKRMDQAILVRMDIFEKLGLNREPKTWDELYDIIAAFKAEYPDASPLVNRWEVSHLLSTWAYAHNTSYSFYLDLDVDDYVFGPDSQAYRDTLTWLNKLYENGMLHKDFATMTGPEYEEAFISNKAFMTYDYQDTAYLEAAKDLVDDGWDLGAILPPEYAPGKTQKYTTLQGYYQYTKAVAASTKYPEELAKFIDWTYSEEGARALFFGIEGETYDMAADGTVDMKADISYQGNPAGTILHHGLNDQNVFSLMPTEAQTFYEKVRPREIAQYEYLEGKDMFAEPKFAARFADENIEKQYSDIKTQAETYIWEQSTKVILGDIDISEWDAVIETCKSTYKTDEALELIRQAYKDTYGK